MVKLGSALMVCGFVMFLTPFFGGAYTMAMPSRFHEGRDAFRQQMDDNSRIHGITFGVAAAGMLFLVGGSALSALGVALRGRQLVRSALLTSTRARTCAFCASALSGTTCVRCGAARA